MSEGSDDEGCKVYETREGLRYYVRNGETRWSPPPWEPDDGAAGDEAGAEEAGTGDAGEARAGGGGDGAANVSAADPESLASLHALCLANPEPGTPAELSRDLLELKEQLPGC